MAGTRREAHVEGVAARGAFVRAVGAAVLAVAVWAVFARYWPVEWDRPTEDERRRIVLVGGGLLALLAAARVGISAVHVGRWARARRWERMLDDPERAHLVPPLSSHVASLSSRSEAGLRLTAVLAAVAAAALVGVAVWLPVDDGNEDPRGALVFFAVLLAWGAVRSWRAARRRRLARQLERRSLMGAHRPAAPPGGPDPAPEPGRAAAIPSLVVLFQVRSGGAEPPAAVSLCEPLHVLYLRLFDNEAGTSRFLSGPWRRCAYVHFLRSADQVTPQEIAEAKDDRSLDALFISTPNELEEALRRQATGRHEPPVPHGVRARWRWVRDPERGRFPVRALLCHGSFWQQAIDLLLARMDHVVLDLTGYRPEHAGTRWELQRVIDRYPIEKVTFLAEPSSDDRFLEAQLTWAWRQMAAGSPNEGTGSRRASVWREASAFVSA